MSTKDILELILRTNTKYLQLQNKINFIMQDNIKFKETTEKIEKYNTNILVCLGNIDSNLDKILANL
jgi:Icc-related predicted phosphoesterase